MTRQILREFLKTVNGESGYANAVKALRVFFCDYLGRPELAVFKVPRRPLVMKRVPTRDELRTFYAVLQSP